MIFAGGTEAVIFSDTLLVTGVNNIIFVELNMQLFTEIMDYIW